MSTTTREQPDDGSHCMYSLYSATNLCGKSLIFPLPGMCLLQELDLPHGRLVDGLLDHGRVGLDVDVGAADGLTQHVGGPARVLPGVLRVDVHDVERDEAKVVALPEAGALLDGLPVLQPLHPQGRVGDRDDPGLKVGPLALPQLQVLHGGGEDGRLGGGLLLHLEPRDLLLLQHLELARLSRRFRDHPGSAWE